MCLKYQLLRNQLLLSRSTSLPKLGQTAAEKDLIPRFEGMLLHRTIRQRALERAWWRTWRAIRSSSTSRGGASPRLPLRLYKHHDRNGTLTRTPVPGADQPRVRFLSETKKTTGNVGTSLYISFADFCEREP